MEDLIDNAKVAVRGGAQIFFSNILSTLISAIGSIIVIRLLSPNEYGLYTISLVPASMLILFGDWGVNAALTKFIAQYRAEGKKHSAASILLAGLILKVGLGVILSSLTFLLADFLSGFILQKPETGELVKVSCIFVLGSQLYTTSWSIFRGFEEMKYNALTQILSSILEVSLKLLLILLGFKALGAVIGFSFGRLVAGTAGLTIILLALYRPIRKNNPNISLSLSDAIKTILKYGLPLAIVTIISGFGLQLYRFLMARYSPTVAIANYGVAANFTVLVGFLTFPVVNVLFPAYSKITEGTKELELAFRASLKYISFLVLPASVGVMALSQPLVSVLFGRKYALAPLYLTLLSASSLYAGLGSLNMGTLLSSQGKTTTILKIGLINLLIGIPLSIILIPHFGVIGFIANNLITGATGTALYIYWIRKLFKFKMWINQSIRTYTASFTMGGIVWATLTLLKLSTIPNNDILLLGAGLVTGATSYLILLPLIGGINQTDIENFKIIFEKMGPLTPIFNILTSIMKKLIIIQNRFNK